MAGKKRMVAQRNGGRERLLMYGETSTPVYKRLMKPEDGMRPQLLNLHSCHTILIGRCYFVEFSVLGDSSSFLRELDC